MIRNNVKQTFDELLGISVLEACRRTGLHRSVVGRLYRNETGTISFDTLDALCSGLGVTSTKIVEYIPDDQMTPEDVQHIEERSKFVKKTTEKTYEYRNKDGG